MMKQVVLAIGVFIALMVSGLIFSSCMQESEVTCIRASSESIDESRNLGAFKGIFYDGNKGIITISHGNTPSFTVNAPPEALETLSTLVVNDTLIMKLTDCFTDDEKFEMYIDIVQPEISYIFTSGFSKVISDSGSVISGNELFLKMSGGGEIDLNVTVSDQLTSEVTGTSELELRGFAKNHSLTFAGNQNVRAKFLQTDNSYVYSSGSANCFVNAADSLSGEIRSSGNILFTGNPLIEVEIVEGAQGEVINDN